MKVTLDFPLETYMLSGIAVFFTFSESSSLEPILYFPLQIEKLVLEVRRQKSNNQPHAQSEKQLTMKTQGLLQWSLPLPVFLS